MTAAKTGFPKLHLHVLRSMARRLGSHLPETTITYHPADAFWWGVSPGVLIVSPDTVRLGEAHRLDPKRAARAFVFPMYGKEVRFRMLRTCGFALVLSGRSSFRSQLCPGNLPGRESRERFSFGDDLNRRRLLCHRQPASGSPG